MATDAAFRGVNGFRRAGEVAIAKPKLLTAPLELGGFHHRYTASRRECAGRRCDLLTGTLGRPSEAELMRSVASRRYVCLCECVVETTSTVCPGFDFSLRSL
jgi:hypothetical protein